MIIAKIRGTCIICSSSPRTASECTDIVPSVDLLFFGTRKCVLGHISWSLFMCLLLLLSCCRHIIIVAVEGRNLVPSSLSSVVVSSPCWRQYKGTRSNHCKDLVCCGCGGMHRADQAGSMSTNQNGEQMCMEPGYLPGSEAAG